MLYNHILKRGTAVLSFFFPRFKCSSEPGFWLFVLTHCVLVILMSALLWQRQMFIKLVTEIAAELQFLSFLFVQQETVDVGEQLI